MSRTVGPSSTQATASPRGPECRFGAVLFIEKEGFLPLFQDVRLAERYDLGLMSSKGLSTTAGRRLVDVMCRRNLPLLVLHDFDKAGFSIIGTLRRNTRRYSFSSTPNVIDLGLRLADVEELGLESETTFDRGAADAKRQNLRINGATEDEIEFLLRQRVELNALSSEQLVKWIERKLDEHGIKKIMPDKETLARAYRANMRAIEIKRAVAKMAEEQSDNVEVPRNLNKLVAAFLKENPAISWDAAIATIAEEAAQ